MTKEQIFLTLLEKYIAAAVNVTDKAKAMQQADDIREAWVSKYSKAAWDPAAQKSKYETKI